MVEQERVPFLDHARLRPVPAICREAIMAVVTLGPLLVHRRRLQGGVTGWKGRFASLSQSCMDCLKVVGVGILFVTRPLVGCIAGPFRTVEEMLHTAWWHALFLPTFCRT